MPLRDPRAPAGEIAPVYATPNPSLRSPEDKLTLWEYMTVAWMSPLISIGYKRQLNDDDVWDLPYEFKHRRLFDNFCELKGSVIGRLLRANGLDLLIITTLALLELGANLMAPLLLQQLLRAMGKDDGPDTSSAMTWAILSLVVRLAAAQSGVFNLWYSRRAYERSRGELITMLFDKTLKRKVIHAHEPSIVEDTNARIESPVASNNEENQSANSPKSGFSKVIAMVRHILAKKKPQKASPVIPPASMGKILNLMRNDAYEIAQRFWEFPALVTQPLSLILSIVLLWNIIGWPCIVGTAVVIVAQLLNVLVAKILIYWENKRRTATDIKLQKVTQFVEAIRHLRWYGWQDSWLKEILVARQHELNLRVISGLWNLLIGFLTEASGALFPVVAFWAYTSLAQMPLPVDIAFPAIDLFQIVISNLQALPGLITVLLNATVAVNRLEAYMLEAERTERDAHDDNAMDVELVSATFSWPGSKKSVIRDVSLKFPRGLTVIYGEVASGKTALLQAILGELDQSEGELIRPNKNIGYCAQTPWLQSMSIRDNILFTYPYNEERYKEVLNACALISDLNTFKHGDLSNIGENGIGLSGGQKARVALARAVYSPAEIILLDDPLSALDHQTAEHIVQKCISGRLLEGRTTVLVTHRTQLCRGLAKQWVEIIDGKTRVLDPVTTGLQSSIRGGPITEDLEADDQACQREEETAIPEKFIEDEHRAHGEVQAKVYWEYIKAGKYRWWALLILIMIIYRIADLLQTWFIKEWGEAYKASSTARKGLFNQLPSPQVDVDPWLKVFLLLAIVSALLSTMARGFTMVVVYVAGKSMFKEVMASVSHATFRFYDVTPVGRLMNRLTSDMNTVDGQISIILIMAVFTGVTWMSSIAVVATATPLFLIFAVILSSAFVVTFLRFLPTSQSLRRLEMVSLTPLLSNFGALAEGLTTIRAFCAQHQFIERVIVVTDKFQKMDHFYWSLQAWLAYRFDSLSALSTFILTLLALYSGVSPGLTAFVLIAAAKFVQSTHLLCRIYGAIQMDFVSVERVVEMLHLEQEPKGSIDPPAWWPSYAGDIVWEKATIRYAPNLDPALQEVSVRIPAGSNTAIVGRTGSGKSTFALALLATITPEAGRILIDGINIAEANHQTLRSRVTFLAQDPVLFPGTLRDNLDPLSEYTDEACEEVLKKIAERHGWTLNTSIEAGGKNLSQGQRQLVGLARAMLRQSSIIILDEATASIDLDTANEIQRVLREEMKQSTVITIAHRLEAVQHADYCIVLEKGRVLQSGKAEDIIKTEMFT
ncbi:ABC bile acid transporter [Pseudovirgaria hyperparasitica]|uniref:ABC bile acid transporter n=1 Tax=Pseudovirgaria hyperparasitica TaxID=470096 RepID=A0A6A6W9E1_9PEZI|nr:ABC bile acid transporter [Pseudovirgaria hyperparasitica]KAF2758207.1 ABC bile acid transporter [Pseudovirgaria hyperparasitica]